MTDMTKENDGQRTIGAFAKVRFASVGDQELEGKVDTGATTSSLHAVNVKVDQQRNKVSFVCPELSQNVITMSLAGAQEVHAAGQEGENRPIVSLDISINGVPLQSVEFNLNDRSNMDVPVLLGQNAIKAGNFTVDINEQNEETFATQPQLPGEEDTSKDDEIKQAVRVLVENNITVADLIKYLVPHAQPAVSPDLPNG